MTAKKQFEALKRLSVLPETNKSVWLGEADEGIEFLRENALADHVAIFAIMPSSWMSSALAPNANLQMINREDLRQARIDLDDTWIIQHSWGGGQGHRVYLEPPLERSSRALEGGEALLFRRSFEGMDRREPFELSQKLLHALGIFFVDYRSAYCRLDENGDLEDIVNIFSAEGSHFYDRFEMVTIRAKELAEYMALSETTLVRRFDFTRVDRANFQGWGNPQRATKGTDDLSYCTGAEDGYGSWANGYQIIRTRLTAEELTARAEREASGANKEYETFIVNDWNNGQITEASCDPNSTGNYFTQSDSPHALSPAFFRAEVLARYKADPNKYKLDERSITCRGAWHLKSYDINDEGQVHAYLCDLALLPIAEQRYWKVFNESPKGSISKRAIENDFQARRSTEYNPVVSLKDKVRLLNEAAPPWWSNRTAELIDAVRTPVTGSEKEWADELLALDQLLVEGLIERKIRAAIDYAGGTRPAEAGSLNALQGFLVARGFSEDEARESIEPFRLLHRLRSKVRGHASSEKAQLSKAALSEFGTYRAHFSDLVTKLDSALHLILATLGAHQEPEP